MAAKAGEDNVLLEAWQAILGMLIKAREVCGWVKYVVGRDGAYGRVLMHCLDGLALELGG